MHFHHVHLYYVDSRDQTQVLSTLPTELASQPTKLLFINSVDSILV